MLTIARLHISSSLNDPYHRLWSVPNGAHCDAEQPGAWGLWSPLMELLVVA